MTNTALRTCVFGRNIEFSRNVILLLVIVMSAVKRRTGVWTFTDRRGTFHRHRLQNIILECLLLFQGVILAVRFPPDLSVLSNFYQLKGYMKETDKSVFLFCCSRYHFWTQHLPICYVNIKSTLEKNVIFCRHFLQQPCILICMVDARRSLNLSIVTLNTRNPYNTWRLFRQEPTLWLQ